MATNVSTDAGVRTGFVDVTGVEAVEVQKLVADTEEAYIERKGGRTYLATEA